MWYFNIILFSYVYLFIFVYFEINLHMVFPRDFFSQLIYFHIISFNNSFTLIFHLFLHNSCHITYSIIHHTIPGHSMLKSTATCLFVFFHSKRRVLFFRDFCDSSLLNQNCFHVLQWLHTINVRNLKYNSIIILVEFFKSWRGSWY